MTPVDCNLGLIAAPDEVPRESNVQPFGRPFVTSTVAPIPVELSGLHYDRWLQLTVDDIGAPGIRQALNRGN
ncbi:MAG: hypothetical protein M3460_17255 [Actinomycetota bacterium]|nr:hypothetical protein [Actinomycetota bacterium]